MKFAFGATALLAVGASAFAPIKATARTSSLSSTTTSDVYTFAKSEEIFAEAKEVGTALSNYYEIPGQLLTASIVYS